MDCVLGVVDVAGVAVIIIEERADVVEEGRADGGLLRSAMAGAWNGCVGRRVLARYCFESILR